MIYDNVVIGTGLSALGCILGLIKNNKQVLCIDASNSNLNNLGKQDSKKVVFCNQGLPLRKINQKFVNNKFFHPVEIIDKYLFGGLSNLWGANALRPLPNDFNEWPLTYKILEPYLEKCETVMNISHFDDDLSKEFGIKKNEFNENKKKFFSEFIKSFFSSNVAKNKNFIYGLARLTLQDNCQISEESFFGCKDQNIFNSKDEIQKLVKEKKIKFIDNLIVKKIIYEGDNLRLLFSNNETSNILTKKLFLGAGPINTPKIVLNSSKNFKNMTISESQPFFIPCIFFGNKFDNKKMHHTLSQAQIIFKNDEANLNNTYYEIKYDEKLIDSIIKIKYSILFYLIPRFFKKRLFVITGFINSKESAYTAEIEKNIKELKIVEKKEMIKKSEKKILNQLKILEKAFSFISLRPLLKFGVFGRGFHLGSSLPMKEKGTKENDMFTKPSGEVSSLKNVFVVDSSNFPNIPASGFSLTIMANAFRIGDLNSSD